MRKPHHLLQRDVDLYWAQAANYCVVSGAYVPEVVLELERTAYELNVWSTEAKRLEGSRLDLEILLFDESMDLVAVSHQVAWVVTGIQKTQRGSRL